MSHKVIAGVFAAALLTAASVLAAQDSTKVSLGLNYGGTGKIGIVILPARWSGADSIYSIVTNDLKNSDRFNVISLPTDTKPDTGAKEYATYTALGAAYALDLSNDNAFGVRAMLHDVKAKQVRQAQNFDLPAATDGADWRMAVHGMADEIVRWAAGQRGIAQTRIVYTRRPIDGGGIWLVDSDGWGEHRILAEKMVSSPTWSQDAKNIAYLGMKSDSSGYGIFLRNLERGTESLLSTGLTGLSLSLRFRPLTDTLAWFQDETSGARPVIWLYQAQAAERARGKRAWSTPFIVSGLTFSPKGDRLAYSSNSTGPQDVYIADVDGTNQKPLCRAALGRGVSRADPDWSPDGRRVVFGQLSDGGWQVMVGDVVSGQCAPVSDVGDNERPRWAPDSRHVLFTSTRSGTPQLWIEDLETGTTRQLTHGGARHAAWSPPLEAAAVTVGQAQGNR